MDRALVEWSDADARAVGSRPQILSHHIQEFEWFDDASLIELFDRYPLDRRQAFTMGTDPSRAEEWKAVDTSGVSGEALLRAVHAGRLWLNLLRVDLVDKRYADLQEQLFREVSGRCPHLKLHAVNFVTLLVSSPQAMVYYHLDAPHQALWHIRGLKRVWVYPACDERFAPQHMVEDIFVGAHEYDEELPYRPEFDRHAEVFDLKPGGVAIWPLNAPHRVVNLGTVNVSLCTGLVTPDAYRRGLIYGANRLLRRTVGVSRLSNREEGLAAAAKCFGCRVARRLGVIRPTAARPQRFTLRVDPDAPLGVAPL